MHLRLLSRVLHGFALLPSHVSLMCHTSHILAHSPLALSMSRPGLEPLSLLASFRSGKAPSQRRLHPGS